MKPVCAKSAPGERTKNLTRIIDAGGIEQFYTGYKDQSPVMLLSYTLKETVVPEKLQRALEKAIERFPVFRVRLALNENRQPVYEKNDLLPCIYENDGKTHTFGKASRGYLFRVSYHSRRISLSIHHMLTDFFGANEFLKYILRCYLHQLDESIGTSKDTIAVDPTDFRDPYDLYGNADAVGYYMTDKWKNELLIPNRMNYSSGVPQQIHSISFSSSIILAAAKKTDTSVFPLLTWMMAKAIANAYDAEDKVVVGSGAANFRTFYDSRTPFCFSHSFPTVLLPGDRSMDLETQMTVQRFRMDLRLGRETVDREVAKRRKAAKQMDGPIEKYVMNQKVLDQERKAREKKSSFFISYTGKMDLPEEIAEYVDSYMLDSPTTRGPVKAASYSWRGRMYINLIEQTCEKRILPELVKILDQFDAACTETDLGDKYYDYYPMEELISVDSTSRL
ncbi:MAG: hypothetical protein IJI61_02790 [Oscillospiraceae bacterium]|nr:hypothetical protein [Oscillospiraceae bacterium]